MGVELAKMFNMNNTLENNVKKKNGSGDRGATSVINYGALRSTRSGGGEIHQRSYHGISKDWEIGRSERILNHN